MCINNHFNVIIITLCFLMSYCENKTDTVPFCRNAHDSLLLVSTLDGRFSALDIENGGVEKWSIATDPGPMLSSSIHKLELSENSQWIRMIPSLSGGLYKFNGDYIQSVPINADSLLSSSFHFSEDVVISGGKEVHSYGIDVSSGRILYQCSMSKCDNFTESIDTSIEVMVLQRNTQTVRAIEPYSGFERWNYSVSQHDVKLLPNPIDECNFNLNTSLNIDVKVIVPDGLIFALSKSDMPVILWKHKFPSPIANIWSLVGQKLKWIDLFGASYTNNPVNRQMHLNPSLYIGMHNKQLYVQESVVLEKYFLPSCGDSSNPDCAPKLPWIPFPAIEGRLGISDQSNETLQLTDENTSTTALSVLYGSEYVNGNGYYLYDIDIETEKSDKYKKKPISDIEVYSKLDVTNSIMKYLNRNGLPKSEGSVISLSHWWKEALVISSAIAFISNFMNFQKIRTLMDSAKKRLINTKHRTREQEMKVIKDTDSGVDLITTNKNDNISSNVDYYSRFLNDFEPLHVLGKGGFGVVFHAKNRIDDCHYAIKRITLPSRIEAREKVMREVKALAKLEHPNIVRYFNAWQECPPSGWQEEQDKLWLNNESTDFPITKFSLSSYLYGSSEHHNVANKSALRKENTDSMLNLNIDKFIKQVPTKAKKEESDSFIVFGSENGTKDTSDAKNLVELESDSMFDSDEHNIMNRTTSKEKVPRIYLYIQMQLCQQNNLQQWMKDNPVRDRTVIFSIFEQIVNAVEYVHLQGLIHRDLKPSNIFFSPEGQIKVGDFGLATEMTDAEFSNNFTDYNHMQRRHTTLAGTQLYMSPEQSYSTLYNYKVDIYALGVILFELLIPFSTEMERYKALVQLKQGKFPTDFQRSNKDEYDLLTLMLSPLPEKRPTTYGIKLRPPLKALLPDCSTYEVWQFELPDRSKRSRNSNSFCQLPNTYSEIFTD